ncbi:MAG: hypothetical protein C4538_09860 [Nitrospiraceae bacterium]|nr:MAG: hypothetical protein C4538_09860 [Nitrospiraceae bacterium]
MEGANYIDFEMNGKYYEPAYGYVELSTKRPFRIYDNEKWPLRGEFIFTGNSRTSARFVILSNTEYAVEVDTDGDGFYDWSKIVNWDEDPGSGHPDQSPPTAPGGVTVFVVSDSEISLSWKAPSDNIGVRNYKIYRDGTYVKTVTETSVSDTGLNYYTQYCYSVSAVDVAGNESPQSSQSCGTTMKVWFSSYPLPPTGLTVAATSHHQIRVSWNAPSGIMGFTGYKIFRNGVFYRTMSYESATTYLFESELYSDTQYCYSVTAYYGNIESAWTDQACATTDRTINVSSLFVSRIQSSGMSGDIALGDLDGDGDLDIFTTGGTAVWINNGQGIFTGNGQIPEAAGQSVALGDIDGDGDFDAFVAKDGLKDVLQENEPQVEGSQANMVFINDGKGNFSDSGQRLGSEASRDVALADLDGDGDIDAFVANKGTYFRIVYPNFVHEGKGQPNSVWMNDGNGNFTDSGQRLGSSPSISVDFGDMDKDGDVDVIVANAGAPTEIWTNDGQGYFSYNENIGNASNVDLAVGDLDGDTDNDVFLIESYKPSTVWLNNGNSIFTDSNQSLGDMHISEDVVMGDLDGDGDIDAFVVNYNSNCLVWINNGHGLFTYSGQGWSVEPSTRAALGDIDNDGDMDIIVNGASHYDSVWINTSRKQ